MKTKLVTLTTAKYSKALLLKSRLEFEGIEAYLANVNLIQSDVASGVKLLVKDTDVKKALQIVNEIEIIDSKKEDIPIRQSISKIICPVDFSEDSLNASYYALQLAAKIKADVKFVYACYSMQPMANPFPDAFSYQIGMGNIFNDEKMDAKEGMKKFKATLTKYIKEKNLPEIRYSASIIFGDPITAIPRLCKKYKSAMVVMGTKGLGKSRNYQAGSVALNTIENVSIPVLVVPREYAFATIENFNAMYLTDFDDRDFSSFRRLMSIISVFGVNVHCIHIQQEKNAINKIMLDELTGHIKNVYSEYDISCKLISSKDISKSVADFVKTNKINLVTLNDRKRNFLMKIFSKSIVKDILFKVNTPLLVFKV
ncbi:MAG TPA: universal stress protein [Bacteroidales bacterium]|nr:universal stress protein [Bacteroidales bacterium]